MVIDERVGSAELELLADTLTTPCRIGGYQLEGLICKTSTALIFVARGGPFGAGEGVLKLTGHQYAPLLDRELGFLNRCSEAGIRGIVRPVRPALEWIDLGNEQESTKLAAILLPFLSGGDLVQWIAAYTSENGGFRAKPALQIGELVGSVLRALLRLPHPIVHGDVKPQNVLLPHPGAALSELTVIDLDASEELDVEIDNLAAAPREVAQRLVDDVNGFGELLYVLATGSEPPHDGEPKPATDNIAFNELVLKCVTSECDGSGYVCLADNGLWRDLEKASRFERARRPPIPLTRFVMSRSVLAALSVLLFAALLAAIAAKFFMA